jgi:hypothetical protein
MNGIQKSGNLLNFIDDEGAEMGMAPSQFDQPFRMSGVGPKFCGIQEINVSGVRISLSYPEGFTGSPQGKNSGALLFLKTVQRMPFFH